MTITKNICDGTATIKPEGWLDTASAPDFHSAITEAAEAETIVFDFDALEYISSSGLREVAFAFKEKGGKVSIINASAEVFDIFKMTGLDKKSAFRSRNKRFFGKFGIKRAVSASAKRR